jgi:hypothetical protein
VLYDGSEAKTVNVMTTHLPPSLVAHAVGELCRHLTAAAQTHYAGTDLVLRHGETKPA